MITYSTKGTCSKQIVFDLDDEHRIHNVKFIGGCSGCRASANSSREERQKRSFRF